MLLSVEYDGRAQLGDDDDAIEVVVHIPDVEQPEWFALVADGAALPRGEMSVTLLDDGIYNAWRGSAVTSHSSDGQKRLLGHDPLTPPVGA